MINVTKNELEALRGIDRSEYGDCITDPVWSWSVTDNCSLAARSIPGVISSLAKKGLVAVSNSGTEDACIEMTAAGVEVYCHEMTKLGEVRRKWIDLADLEKQRVIWAAERARKAADRIAPEAEAYLVLAGCAA